MYSNLSRNIEKIFTEIYKLHTATKTTIKYGTLISFAILCLGIVLIFINHSKGSFDPYFEFIATAIVKSGFTNLAIVIIGAILMDFTFGMAKK